MSENVDFPPFLPTVIFFIFVSDEKLYAFYMHCVDHECSWVSFNIGHFNLFWELPVLANFFSSLLIYKNSMYINLALCLTYTIFSPCLSFDEYIDSNFFANSICVIKFISFSLWPLGPTSYKYLSLQINFKKFICPSTLHGFSFFTFKSSILGWDLAHFPVAYILRS